MKWFVLALLAQCALQTLQASAAATGTVPPVSPLSTRSLHMHVLIATRHYDLLQYIQAE